MEVIQKATDYWRRLKNEALRLKSKKKKRGHEMIKYYGEFSCESGEFRFSLYAEDAHEADQRFLKLACLEGWKYKGIVFS